MTNHNQTLTTIHPPNLTLTVYSRFMGFPVPERPHALVLVRPSACFMSKHLCTISLHIVHRRACAAARCYLYIFISMFAHLCLRQPVHTTPIHPPPRARTKMTCS